MSNLETQLVTLPENFDPQNEVFSAIVLTPDEKIKTAFSKKGQSEFTSFLSLEQMQFATDQALKQFVDPETNSEATRAAYCGLDSAHRILALEIETRDEKIKRRKHTIALYKKHGLLEAAEELENIPPFIVGYERARDENTYILKAVDQPSFWIFGTAELHRNGLQYEYSQLDIFEELSPSPAASKLAFIASGNAGGSSLATPNNP